MVKRFFISLFVLGLVACSQPDDSTIRFGLSQMPQRLDPRLATDAASSRVNRLLFESLVDFDARMQPIPSLATWQQITPQHYRFTLKPNRKPFSNGSALTSKHVADTYRWILDKDNASPHRGTLKIIERIATPDNDTIDFYLNKADPLFPGYLTIGIVAQNGSLHGNGVFVIEGEETDSRLCLKRQTDTVRVCFELVGSPEVRVLKLVKGEIDILQNDLMPELERYLEKQENVSVARSAGSNFAYLGFNMNDPITGNADIRQAVALAIDRDEIIQHLMGGNEQKAAALLPPAHWAGANLPLVEHDLQRAKVLLAKHGYNEMNPLPLEYKTSSNAFRIRLATVIQAQLKRANIQVTLKTYDWGTFFGDIKSGRFQMYSLIWVGIKSPDIFRYVFHSQSLPPDGANRGRYVNTQVDQWLDQAQASQDRQEQAQLYQQVQAQLLNDLPYVPMWYEDHFLAHGKRIGGYALAPDGNYDGLKTVVKVP